MNHSFLYFGNSLRPPFPGVQQSRDANICLQYIVSCQPSSGKKSWKYCLVALIGSHSPVVNRADYPEERYQISIAFISNSNH